MFSVVQNRERFYLYKTKNYIKMFSINIPDEDIKQEIYLAALTLNKSFVKNKSSFNTYCFNYLIKTALRSILRNYSKDLIVHPYRSICKDVKDYLSFYELDEKYGLQPKDMRSIELSMELREEIKNILLYVKDNCDSESYKVFKMFFVQGLNPIEIAQLSNVSSRHIRYVLRKTYDKIESKFNKKTNSLYTLSSLNKMREKNK
ncbi:MAG: hypothetical protein J6Y02_19605 [Pseudobutyrivibrio sp.]|nr:hypothetical protein [Pseudobutyrivibrio sp.]